MAPFSRRARSATVYALAVVSLLILLGAAWLQAQLSRDRLRQAERIHSETSHLALALWGSVHSNTGAIEQQLAYLDAVAPVAGSDPELLRAVVQGYLIIGAAGDAPTAVSCYRRAWNAISAESRKAIPDLAAAAASKLSQAVAARGDMDEAVKLARESAAIRETLPGDRRNQAEAYEALADLLTRRGFRQAGEWEEAMAAYRKAIAAWESAQALHTKDTSLGVSRASTLMKLGDAMREAGRQGALENYRSAVSLLGASGVQEQPALAAGLGRRIGEALTESGDFDGARSSLTEALQLCTLIKPTGPDDQQSGREESRVLASMATLSERVDRPLDAAAELRRSAQVLEALYANEPDNQDLEAEYASTLTRLGGVFMRAALPIQANGSTARGLALMKEMARRPGAPVADVARAASCLQMCEPKTFRDPAAAVVIVEEAIAASTSPDPELLELLSNAYLLAGSRDAGMSAAVRALSLLPAGSFARQRLEKRLAGQ